MRQLVAKFPTYAVVSIWWPYLQLMQFTESISGSIVPPLAMFYWQCHQHIIIDWCWFLLTDSYWYPNPSRNFYTGLGPMPELLTYISSGWSDHGLGFILLKQVWLNWKNCFRAQTGVKFVDEIRFQFWIQLNDPFHNNSQSSQAQKDRTRIARLSLQLPLAE